MLYLRFAPTRTPRLYSVWKASTKIATVQLHANGTRTTTPVGARALRLAELDAIENFEPKAAKTKS